MRAAPDTLSTLLDDIADALHGADDIKTVTVPAPPCWPEPCSECRDEPAPWRPADAVALVAVVARAAPPGGGVVYREPACVEHLHGVTRFWHHHGNRFHVEVPVPLHTEQQLIEGALHRLDHEPASAAAAFVGAGSVAELLRLALADHADGLCTDADDGTGCFAAANARAVLAWDGPTPPHPGHVAVAATETALRAARDIGDPAAVAAVEHATARALLEDM